MTSLSHFASLLAFSVLVSTVLATLVRDESPSRLRFGAKLFAGFLLTAIVMGRLMARFQG